MILPKCIPSLLINNNTGFFLSEKALLYVNLGGVMTIANYSFKQQRYVKHLSIDESYPEKLED